MKIVGWLLLCLLLCGCAKVELPNIPTATTAPAQTFSWEPQLLADTPDCGFWVENCRWDADGNYVLEIFCQNRGEGAQLFSCRNVVIDGWQAPVFWGQEIPGGEAGAYDLTISRKALEDSGIQSPQSVAFDLRIFSLMDLNQTYLVSKRCTVYPTGMKPSQVQVPPPPEGCWVLADNTGCICKVCHCRQAGSEITLQCFLENKTRQELIVRIHAITLDGQALEDVFTLQLSPGARHMATVTLPVPEGTGTVQTLELELYICQADVWFGEVWVQERFSLPVTEAPP